MILKKLSPENAISPYPARTIADLELDEKVYKPDFEISSRYQAFSKELVRISLLGLGVYGFLIKLASEQKLAVTQSEKIVGLCGLFAFAISAGCALLHGVLSSRCLGHQLVISRYLGRLEGDRWDEGHKQDFRKEIERQQKDQKAVLIRGNWFLLSATVALIVGAAMVGLCSALALLPLPAPHGDANVSESSSYYDRRFVVRKAYENVRVVELVRLLRLRIKRGKENQRYQGPAPHTSLQTKHSQWADQTLTDATPPYLTIAGQLALTTC